MRGILIAIVGLVFSSMAALGSESAQCLGCHDFGADSPVHSLLEGHHGNAGLECRSCHGASDEHLLRPTIAAPDISYGPRWNSGSGAQDEPCLECHRDDVAAHWQDALHMFNRVTCTSCHDLHTGADRVLTRAGEIEVCGVCHKSQKQGIHELVDLLAENPACTSCHNPHADQRAVAVMLDNRSEGCRSCHDLTQMASSEQTTAKANSYHKVMAQPDRTCLDCHTGIAHGSTAGVEPFVPLAQSERTVTLFYPGQSDFDWILSEHPGAQPFRQGTNCQQCHRGDEIDMGRKLGGGESPSRDLRIHVAVDKGELVLVVSWLGDSADSGLALMLGDDANEDFRRGGCWAACHSDLPGMSRDRGQTLEKYLAESRQQQRRIGQPALLKTPEQLAAMRAEGNFVEMWQVQLANGGLAAVRSGLLLERPELSASTNVRVSGGLDNGRWRLELRRVLQAGPDAKSLLADQRYTLGVALYSSHRSGAAHWVSLPLTFSLDGEGTDLRVD